MKDTNPFHLFSVKEVEEMADEFSKNTNTEIKSYGAVLLNALDDYYKRHPEEAKTRKKIEIKN